MITLHHSDTPRLYTHDHQALNLIVELHGYGDQDLPPKRRIGVPADLLVRITREPGTPRQRIEILAGTASVRIVDDNAVLYLVHPDGRGLDYILTTEAHLRAWLTRHHWRPRPTSDHAIWYCVEDNANPLTTPRRLSDLLRLAPNDFRVAPNRLRNSDPRTVFPHCRLGHFLPDPYTPEWHWYAPGRYTEPAPA